MNNDRVRPAKGKRPQFARRVDAAKMHGGHASSLEIVLCETLNIRSTSSSVSSALREPVRQLA
ncbi:MAG: hypothetical protein WAL71_11750 [Terriglobales bacterium]|jgi:hypothetical protein